MIPQLTYIAITFLALGLELSRHGEEKKRKYNIWNRLIGLCITYAILALGGFFNVFID